MITQGDVIDGMNYFQAGNYVIDSSYNVVVPLIRHPRCVFFFAHDLEQR